MLKQFDHHQEKDVKQTLWFDGGQVKISLVLLPCILIGCDAKILFNWQLTIDNGCDA